MLTQSACVYSKQVNQCESKATLALLQQPHQRPVVHTRNTIAALDRHEYTQRVQHQHSALNNREYDSTESTQKEGHCGNQDNTP